MCFSLHDKIYLWILVCAKLRSVSNRKIDNYAKAWKFIQRWILRSRSVWCIRIS